MRAAPNTPSRAPQPTADIPDRSHGSASRASSSRGSSCLDRFFFFSRLLSSSLSLRLSLFCFLCFFSFFSLFSFFSFFSFLSFFSRFRSLSFRSAFSSRRSFLPTPNETQPREA